MVQVARGYWYEPFITPTLQYIDSEWHERCYPGEFAFQSPPYICPTCGERIVDGESVVYVTVGSAPEEGYIRPESRGYQLARIEHVNCYRRHGP